MDNNNTHTSDNTGKDSRKPQTERKDVEESTPTDNRKRKSKVIRKLLVGATLSTAFVSFVATAQGMEMYIFQGNLLFAGIISAAVQGSLYTLSISGIPLLYSNKLRFFGKIMACILWAFLLCTSSIFSYVYVSKTAYPDNVMHSDAEQNISLYLQEQEFILLEVSENLAGSKLSNIINYTTTLNGNQSSGFKVNNEDITAFNNHITNLQEAENSHRKTDLSELFSTVNIRASLEKLKSGNFTDTELSSCKKALSEKIEKIKEKIKEYDARIIALDEEILSETVRLTSFNSYDTKWYEANENLKKAKNDKELTEKYKGELSDFVGMLEECFSFVSDTFELGTENTLNSKTKELQSEINKEKINTGKVLAISEDIYNRLLQGNTSENTQEALSQYPAFKQNVRSYKNYIEIKQIIEQELELIGNYTQKMISQNTSVNNNLVLDNENSIESSPVSLDDASVSKNENIQWSNFWSARLANMLYVIQNIPSEDSATNKIDKARLLKGILNRRRLYLLELNDFDRALTLAKETFFGFHEHGFMVIVSLAFAFGLDLFSMAAGILLFFFKSKPSKYSAN